MKPDGNNSHTPEEALWTKPLDRRQILKEGNRDRLLFLIDSFCQSPTLGSLS